jgi:hypothetical protein
MAEVPAGWVPTFALKPKENEKFVPKQAKAIVEELVEKSCKGLTYAADKCQALSMQLAEQIRDALHSTSQLLVAAHGCSVCAACVRSIYSLRVVIYSCWEFFKFRNGLTFKILV